MEWEIVIGLEVHVQLLTKTKLFSGSPNTYGAQPNTKVCEIDLGMPGILPVLNAETIKLAIKFGLAIHATIQKKSTFDRKNYLYPDLPKGYQITQWYNPILLGGKLTIDMEEKGIYKKKTINIIQAHLEEDAGKSIHDMFDKYSAIDLNRAGIPLLEIVSAPEMSSSKEAIAYLKKLHSLVKYIDICSGNMQEGAFRCDVNISIRKHGQKKLGTRVEIKNINSFKFVKKSIDYEIKRQIAIVESGGSIIQETRLFDSTIGETRSMRLKEAMNDYRYFHDPDLPTLLIDESMIVQAQSDMPELPEVKIQRFIKNYKLTKYEAKLLIASKAIANFYEKVVNYTKNYKLAANWILGDMNYALRRADLQIENSPITPKQLGALLTYISDDTISLKIAKKIFEEMFKSGKNPDIIIEEQNLHQVNKLDDISKIIDEVLLLNPRQLAQYRSGKNKLFGFFVGQIMKASKDKANPKQVNKLLNQKLH